MLADKDRIFRNLYGQHDWGLKGARARGAWDGTNATSCRRTERLPVVARCWPGGLSFMVPLVRHVWMDPAPAPGLRFAPSPNGLLHLGHAYSALMNARAAAALNGRLLLRFDDLDRTRSRTHYEFRQSSGISNGSAFASMRRCAARAITSRTTTRPWPIWRRRD